MKTALGTGDGGLPRVPDRDAMVGAMFALGAFGIWGFLPVYFKVLHQVSALEILAHRIVWSVVLVGLGLIVTRRWPEVLIILANKRMVLRLLITALLLSCNWLLFIWAVNNAHMLQGSLGYYINPLVNVVLGVVLLGERLTPAQWTAVALTVAGVGNLALGLGEIPWIALTLALLFGFYGYVRKTAPVGAAAGLFVETLVLFVPALLYLIYLFANGTGKLGAVSLNFDLLLIASGVLTSVPLIFFTAAARRLRYATVGFFQYLAPTIQFLLAVLAYGEDFTDSHKITFGLIWTALAIYSIDTMRRRRANA